VNLLIGVVLLVAGVLGTAAALAQDRARSAGLLGAAGTEASAFEAYLERARSLNLLLAQDRALYTAVVTPAERRAADEALLYLEVLYPGAIGEACLIDERGVELARATNGTAAPVADLSTEEASAPFFAPTLALPEGRVHQAEPYVSPDTGEWVISNSTWVRGYDGSRRIVHFEVALASFLQNVLPGLPGDHAAVVDQRTGRVLLTEKGTLPTEEAGFPSARWSASLASVTADSGHLSVDGHEGAFRRIDRSAGDGTDWIAVQWSPRPMRSPLAWAGAAAAVLGVLLLVLALAQVRRSQRSLRAAARLDHLTGLGNRQALEEALTFALAGRPAEGEQVGVLLLDLDGFKQINDSLGHDRGDVVLQEIARRLHANVLEHDIPARLGGDEFAVVLNRLHGAEDIEAVARRLREALVRPIELDGVPRFVGASIGAAVHPQHGSTAVELLRAADSAMYVAKRGREGVRVYDPGTASGADDLGLAAELLSAIEGGGLELVFQAERSLATGEVMAVEALARWSPPGRPAVPPSRFVPLAEQTGLIRPLTSLTLRLALDEAARWRAAGTDIPVSVNLSGRVVWDRSLPGEVAQLLAERGLPPQALVLEVTETALIEERTGAVEVLSRLRETGVRVELDDFGSGYASFAALRDLPLDAVKLDGALVASQVAGDARLLQATVELAHSLGLDVVAEGIEDAECLAVVTRLGCDRGQGWHLAPAYVPSELRPFLLHELPLSVREAVAASRP